MRVARAGPLKTVRVGFEPTEPSRVHFFSKAINQCSIRAAAPKTDEFRRFRGTILDFRGTGKGTEKRGVLGVGLKLCTDSNLLIAF
jgi:hypothetical protein